ncbi:hypothetical protein CRG98_005332 [Punica granatum]|uniref:Uncharacterized protein n=1 Tax=Punica granatum TaxID=22663 RepID=A0A2I0L0N3_PUNGR|nr:hypothetical protein CRG98_005332 [Punica granatum]
MDNVVKKKMKPRIQRARQLQGLSKKKKELDGMEVAGDNGEGYGDRERRAEITGMDAGVKRMGAGIDGDELGGDGNVVSSGRKRPKSDGQKVEKELSPLLVESERPR